jgi:hypothetical protein
VCEVLKSSILSGHFTHHQTYEKLNELEKSVDIVNIGGGYTSTLFPNSLSFSCP